MEHVKAFFKGLMHHWALTIVFVFVVVVFLGATIGALYDRLATTVPFLPARRA